MGLIFGRQYKAHRVIFKMIHGYEPDLVDHINRDTGDNRPENLRETDKFLNAQNRNAMATNPSGVVGVSSVCGKWRAQAVRYGVRHYIGVFPTVEAAAEARAKVLAHI